MQEESTPKLITNEISDDKPHLIALAAVHPQNVLRPEGPTFRGNERGTSGPPGDVSPRGAPPQNGTLSDCNGQISGSFVKGPSAIDVGSSVGNHTTSPESLNDEMSADERSIVSSSSTAEEESLPRRSIRDRIAALSAAAGVSGLDSTPSTPGREKIRKTFIKAVSVSPSSTAAKKTSETQQTWSVTESLKKTQEKVEKQDTLKTCLVTESLNKTQENVENQDALDATTKKGVAFDVEFEKAPTNGPPAHVLNRLGRNNIGKKNENVIAESSVEGVPGDPKDKSVAFEVSSFEFGKATTNGPPAHVLKRLGRNNFGRKNENVMVESSFGGEPRELKDKGVAFEVTLSGEPRSGRSRDESVLVQSPFRVLKTRAKVQDQPMSVSTPVQPLRAQPVYVSKIGEKSWVSSQKDAVEKDDSTSDAIEVESDVGGNVDMVASVQRQRSDDLASQNGSASKAPPDEVQSSVVAPASSAPAKEEPCIDHDTYQVSSEIATKKSCAYVLQELKKDVSLVETAQAHRRLNKAAPKRSIFALDPSRSVVDATNGKVNVADVLHDQTKKEESAHSELQSTDTEIDQILNETSEKRSTFSLHTVSQAIDHASNGGLSVANTLHDLASKDEIKQKADLDVHRVPSDITQKRSTFTLDTVSRALENAVTEGGTVGDGLYGLTMGGNCTQELTESDHQVPEPPRHTLQKRSTFTLDTVARSIENTAGDGVTVADVLQDLAKEADCSQTVPQPGGQASDPPRDTLQKRSTFTLDTVARSIENTASDGKTVADVLHDLATEEDRKETRMQSDFGTAQPLSDTSQKRNTFTLESVAQSIENTAGDGVSVSGVLQALATEEDRKQTYMQSDFGTAQLQSDTSQKRNTFTLDSVSQSIENAASDGVSVSDVLHDLATEEDSEQTQIQSDFVTAQPQSSTSQKRNTFTLDVVSQSIEDAASDEAVVSGVLHALATDEDRKETQLQTDVGIAQPLSDTSQKRNTFTLDTVSQSIENVANDGVPVADMLLDLASEEDRKQTQLQSDFGTAQLQSDTSTKRNTFTLDTVAQSVDNALEQGVPLIDVLQRVEKEEEVKSKPSLSTNGFDTDRFVRKKQNVSASDEKRETLEKRSTGTLDSGLLESQSGAEKGLPVVDDLSQFAKEDVSHSRASEPLEKRGTFSLDTVSQTLDDAQDKGLPVVHVLDKLASELATQPATSSEERLPAKSQNRGTYTLDTVSHAIEEAVEKGIPVSETLNHIAQEGEKPQQSIQDNLPATQFVRGPNRIQSGRSGPPSDRDEIEASFEDALEQLDDCDTFDSGESHSAFSNRPEKPFSETPGNRGTYPLDDVSKSVQDGAKEGVPVVETLERLSKKSCLEDGAERTSASDQKRGTYTLDEVSLSLKAASQQGIPVVEALENIARANDASGENSGNRRKTARKRGTYTLEEVSQSLAHAENTGIPVIDALEGMSKEKSRGSLRLKMPDNRGTYTLDTVSHTLEKAQEKGLPVVDTLGQLAGSQDAPLRQTTEAVHRRQEKLTNRKTYAMASPLETIGEGRKLRLYDGSQRRMLSPISFHMKSKDIATNNVDDDCKSRGLGVVQKLDFLTSACELLLETTAKQAAQDRQRLSSAPEESRRDPTPAESTRSSAKSMGQATDHELVEKDRGDETNRNTYSLENVSFTLDDANAAGIPIVDTLDNMSGVAKEASKPKRTNLMRLNSKSDSELTNGADGIETPDRYTHSLGDVSRTLEDAKKAGIPVIKALEELTIELAEFSRTAMSRNVQKVRSNSGTPLNEKGKETPCTTPYPPPIRKAYSLDDIALAVKQAFKSGTSLGDILGGITNDEPTEPVLSSRDIRPRSVDSGFLSSLSDFDVSQSFESSPRNRSNTYIIDSSNEELDSAKSVDRDTKNIISDGVSPSPVTQAVQEENRRTFTLDQVGRSVDSAVTRGVPVVKALGELSDRSALFKDNAREVLENNNENTKQFSTEMLATERASDTSSSVNSFDVRRSSDRKRPAKPKRQGFKKPKSLESNSESFVIEYFSSSPEKEPSKFKIVENSVESVDKDVVLSTDAEENKNNVEFNPEKSSKELTSPAAEHSRKPALDHVKPFCQVSQDKSLVDADELPIRDPDPVVQKSKDPSGASNNEPTRGRAMWRSSGSVLDKIASLMDAAEGCGLSAADVLNQVKDSPSEAQGEIQESPEDHVEDEQAMTSQLAYLRMQLDEKRRHIEAEKFREQEQWEDQRRRLGQTAFWYVIGKAQGGQEFGEGNGAEVAHSDQPPLPGSRSQGKLKRPEPELPSQPSPPIAWSSPASSPLPASAHRPSPAHGQLYETREFRLSEHPPSSDRNISRPSSEPADDVAPRQTPVPARPSSHEPAASHYSTPTRKCWDVNTAVSSTPPPFVRPETAQAKSESKAVPRGGGGAFEFEVEVEQQTPSKKGLAMFIGDDTNTTTESLTPEQEKKKEKFLKLRQRKQEEERTRKEAEHEKKRRKEEKQREKEMLQKMEEERLRREELERQKTEQEWRAREATQIQAPRVPDSYGTYRAEPRKPSYDVGDDTNSYFVLGPTQPTGFSEFSGPQCYVKPSGKSNRKLIVNAVSHVCLSGTVNQEQKEKCLQAVSESDGHHFMILFKDGLKFRGLYIHNLENDQLYKIFGIGPRLITAKMVDSLYKYNSGGKEFVKIPSKTLSVSVDGLAIHKSCWQSGKPAVQSKTASNLKRPPRPPQR